MTDEPRDVGEAFCVIPLGYGSMAPGASAAMLAQAWHHCLEGRHELLREKGLPPDPTGDVVIVCVAKDYGTEFANAIVEALGDPDTVRDG